MLMSGGEDGGKRATLAFVAAVSAAAMERPVQVFLADDGVRWGDPDEALQVEMTGFPPLAELIQEYLDLGGKLLACSTCERFCMARISDLSPNAGPPCRCAAWPHSWIRKAGGKA